MVAVSRWVKFDSNADTFMTAATSNVTSGTGTIGYAIGSSTVPGITTITGTACTMGVGLNDGGAQYITLTEGTNLDCRTVARDIAFKLKQLADPAYDLVNVTYENNKFKIYASTLGASSSVEIFNGNNGKDCLHLLGMAAAQNLTPTVDYMPGISGSNKADYTGSVLVSGVYKGQFDDIYTVMIGTAHPISGSVISGIYAGTCTLGGDWNEAANDTYVITVSNLVGSAMNQGSGQVPTFTWTSSPAGDSNIMAPVELLYSNYWYNIGTKGLRVKFSDSVFGLGDTITISCVANTQAKAGSATAIAGEAQYVWSSLREGKSGSVTTTTAAPGTAVGTKGVTIAFSNSGFLTARDSFRIICSGPQPTMIGVTVLNFGSVTVSTYSPTQVVWFELLSGAIQLLTPKFGLQSHGAAQHHYAGNADTKFAFGSSGEAHPGVAGGQKVEWKKGIQGNTDLASDVVPVGTTLYQTEDNMPVVSTADQSIALGVAPGNMVSDFIYLAIKLGSLETGANSSIIWRVYFDYA